MIKDKIEVQDQIIDIKINKAYNEYIYLKNENNDIINENINLIIKNYLIKYYREAKIQDINDDFFEMFYTYYLSINFGITSYHIEQIFNELYNFMNYLGKNYNLKNLKIKSKILYKKHLDEINRTNFIIQKMKKYGEVPVICWDPFIIDITCYKNMKKKENNLDRFIVYNQGYFILQDKIGTNVIFNKKDNTKDYFKIKVDIPLVSEMKIGDIIHMSIKRKMFSTTWNLIHIKGYFSKNAIKYI